MKLSLLEQLILGILSEQDRHGYDIEKVIAERGMREWTDIGFSSIYYLLKQLEKKKLVDVQSEGKSPQSRKLFRITKQGLEECKRATKATLLDSHSSEPLLVGLANTPLIGTDSLINTLKERTKKTKQDINRIERTRNAQAHLPVFVQALFDYNMYKMRAEIEWSKATIRKLKEENMEKVDFKKELACYQAKKHQFSIVDMPKLQYLMIDGHGDPNTSQEYKDAIMALYPVAYKLKFASKLELGKDYTVMPLEGLWWAKDMDAFTSGRDKSQWDFTMMIMQPDWITEAMFKAAIKKVAEKEPPVSLAKVRLETLDEGKSVQTLHIGSFDDEADILAKMHQEFIPENKLKLTGKHHEIYFSDFRKVAPDKLRTILRQPVISG